MDRRDGNRNTNILIDGKDINRQTDGQTEKEQIDKQMDRWERNRNTNRCINGKDINRKIDGQTGKI